MNEMKLSSVVGLAVVVFIGVLAVMIGGRLTTEALAVLLGVVVGVLASAPVTALVVYVLMKQRAPERVETVVRTVSAPVESMPVVDARPLVDYSRQYTQYPGSWGAQPVETALVRADDLPPELQDVGYGPAVMAGRASRAAKVYSGKSYVVIGGEEQ